MMANAVAAQATVPAASFKALMAVRYRIAPRAVFGQRSEATNLIAPGGSRLSACGRTVAACAIMLKLNPARHSRGDVLLDPTSEQPIMGPTVRRVQIRRERDWPPSPR